MGKNFRAARRHVSTLLAAVMICTLPGMSTVSLADINMSEGAGNFHSIVGDSATGSDASDGDDVTSEETPGIPPTEGEAAQDPTLAEEDARELKQAKELKSYTDQAYTNMTLVLKNGSEVVLPSDTLAIADYLAELKSSLNQQEFRLTIHCGALSAEDYSAIIASVGQYVLEITVEEAVEVGFTTLNQLKYNNRIERIEFPHITTLSERAFYNLKELSEVVFPDVTEVGERAFRDCRNLKIVDMPRLKKVGDSGFNYCYNLSSIDLSKVEFVGDEAFNDCILLLDISLPKVTSIGLWGFAYLAIIPPASRTIKLPAIPPQVGPEALGPVSLAQKGDDTLIFVESDGSPCEDQKSIYAAYYAAGHWKSILGWPKSNAAYTTMKILNMNTLNTVPMPSDQLAIEEYLDEIKASTDGAPLCITINSDELPYEDYVAIINKLGPQITELHVKDAVSLQGFSNIGFEIQPLSDTLTSISFPHITDIDEMAFNNFSVLESVDFPNLTNVGSMAFQNCTSLSSINLARVRKIESRAFTNFESLRKIYLPGQPPEVKEDSFMPTLFEHNMAPIEFVDENGTPYQEQKAYLDLYLKNPIWRKIIAGPDTPVPEEEPVEIQLRLAQRTISAHSMTEAFSQLCASGSSPADVRDIQIIGDVNTVPEDDWVKLNQFSAVDRIGIVHLPGSSQRKGTIPDTVLFPMSVSSVTFEYITTIPANALADHPELSNLVLEHVSEVRDRAFANCPQLIQLIVKDAPILGTDVFDGCTAKNKQFVLDSKDSSLPENESYFDEHAPRDSGWGVWRSEEAPVDPEKPDEPNKPDKPSTSGGNSSSTANTGTWRQNEHGWWFDNGNGTWSSNQWSYLYNNSQYAWFYFDKDGYMKDGWLTVDGATYFLHNISDGTRGHMYTGWHQIDGKWFYFDTSTGSECGKLYVNRTTPDGFRVDGNGVRIQ